MSQPGNKNQSRRGWIFLCLALLFTGIAWIIPSRWRSVHPAVIRAAGRGTPGVVDYALAAANQQRAPLAVRLNDAAIAVGLPNTNEVAAVLAAGSGNRATSPEYRFLGGPDAAVAALLPPLSHPPEGQRISALDVFLPSAHRSTLRTNLGLSRSPGVQVLLATLALPTQQFVPVNQPGGQPFEAVVLLTATLYERERFPATFAQELRSLSDQAMTDPTAARRLEEFYLNLLSLARRLDWTSLAELTRNIPSFPAFEQFATAVRVRPNDFALLYAGALMSGDAAATGRHLTAYGNTGQQGLTEALRAGAGGVRMLTREGLPVRTGLWSPDFLANAVLQYPIAWGLGRSELFFVAAALAVLSLGAFAAAGVPESEPVPRTGFVPLALTVVVLGGFLVFASEPLPGRRQPPPTPRFLLNYNALTKPSGVANSIHPLKNIMEPTTLITVLIFGAIQLVVYVICVRKIIEISRLPDPPSVRLRLLENEENLFDSGLYVGIGGTAAALVMQVLQMVEANLLAAYSSNLMGIICVAMVKIGHVRKARRTLILESQRSGDFPGSLPAPAPSPGPGPIPAHPPSTPSPSTTPAPITGVNPFTFR